MTAVILVLNAGSSSLKYKLFRGEEELHAGHYANIGSRGARTVSTGAHKMSRSEAHEVQTHSQAVHAALRDIARAFPGERIEFVAHRVVHGGERFTRHTVITKAVEDGIDELCSVAPLHNPANLAGIRAARGALPDATHIAFFDTAFHHTIPKFAFLYGLPYELYTKYGIRKYGFHGLSHEYSAHRVHELTHSAERIITCHLGAGSSLCAVHHGKSVDTTMGFSPLDGLLMATRTGELDPDVPLYLMQKEGLSITQVLDLLNNRSGLKGITGHADLREVKAAADKGDELSQTAIDMLCYRIATAIGAYAVALGGVRALTFTGGIGENAAFVRSQVCAQLAPLGIALDEARNERGLATIHAPHSRVSVHVIAANEELHMARLVLAGQYSAGH